MKIHGGAVQGNAETLPEVPILCDPNSPNLILPPPPPPYVIPCTHVNIQEFKELNRNIN